MTTKHINDPGLQITYHGGSRYATDASCIGIAPGEAPDAITFSCMRFELDVRASTEEFLMYFETESDASLKVFND